MRVTEADVSPASGEQYILRRGGAIAQIGQVAAVLRGFSVDGVEYTERWPDHVVPPMGAGIVLMPWPNRVADGRWVLDGAGQQLDITEPATGNAIHGLLRNTAYHAVSVAADAVTLAAPIFPQHGYPFVLHTAVTYALTDDGLLVEHRVTNRGSRPAPFGCGAHPYLRVGAAPVADLVLTVGAATRIIVDNRLVPVGRESVRGGEADLSGGVRLRDVDLDTALTDLTAVNGRFEHRLQAPDGRGVVLWADLDFGWVQVFSPSIFPVDGPRKAIAIEPMTCSVDALNNGEGLKWVQPGETWSAAWGLTPFGPD
jgi:aldose 1-epimerase